jgi:hypothetical protein
LRILQDAAINVAYVCSQVEQLAEIGLALSQPNDQLLAASFRQVIEASLHRTQRANLQVAKALLRVTKRSHPVRLVRWVLIDQAVVDRLKATVRQTQEGLSFAIQILEM